MTDPAREVMVLDAREEERAWGEWQRELLRYVHRLTGDADLAEDVAQESLVRLFALRAEREIANPRAWLFRVATNQVRDLARRSEMMRRRVPPIDAFGPATPEDELSRKHAIREVRDALDRLSPRDRELLMLRESGFRYKEIAEVIGVKTESVPTLAMRALDRFRKAYGAESHDEASR